MTLAVPTSKDRIMAGLRAIIRAQSPNSIYSGFWEYTITACTSTTIDCIPVVTNAKSPPPVPSQRGIPFKSSLLGETVTPTVGNTCVLVFLNQDPSRPRIISIDPIPVIATVDATATVNIGPSAALVALAGGAEPVALGPPVATLAEAIRTYIELEITAWTGLASYFTGISMPTLAGQCTAAASGGTVLAAACVTAESAVIAEKVTAT